jgi:hypothetical protein
MDFNGLVLISMVWSWFLGMPLIFMNSSGLLNIAYDFYKFLLIFFAFIMNSRGFLWISKDQLCFLQFCLNVSGLVWFLWVYPDFLQIFEEFHTTLIISNNCSRFLYVGYNFYEFVWKSVYFSWYFIDWP